MYMVKIQIANETSTPPKIVSVKFHKDLFNNFQKSGGQKCWWKKQSKHYDPHFGWHAFISLIQVHGLPSH